MTGARVFVIFFKKKNNLGKSFLFSFFFIPSKNEHQRTIGSFYLLCVCSFKERKKEKKKLKKTL